MPPTDQHRHMNIPGKSHLASLLTHVSLLVFVLVLFIGGSGGAMAAQSTWDGDSQIGEARLISAVSATGDLATLPLGVEFTLASGWKIYWRTPGEAGLAPVLDLSSSSAPDMRGDIRWPLPRRFDAFGFDNFGYANTVILPLDVTGHEIGAPVRIIAELEALTAEAINRKGVDVIVIDTDPGPSTAAGGTWWEVGVPEVSKRAEVASAYQGWLDGKKRQLG